MDDKKTAPAPKPAAPDKRAPLRSAPDGRRDMAPRVPLTREPPTAIDHQRGAPPPKMGSRSATFSGSSYNADAHTVEAVFSSGAGVQRYFGIEMLAISPEAINLDRVGANLCPFLNAHNQFDIKAVLGRVIAASIEGGQLVGTVQFNETEAGVEAEGMVQRGELTGISIGYTVDIWQLTEMTDAVDTWTAQRWELLEVSLVPVPADSNAGVRSHQGTIPGTAASTGSNEKDEDMNRNLPGGGVAHPNANRGAAPAAEPVATPTPAAEAVRAAEPAPISHVLAVTRFGAVDAVDFMDSARSLGVDARGRELVDQNSRGEIGTEAARAALLQAGAEAQRTRSTAGPSPSGIVVSEANAEASRAAIAGAIVARTLGTKPDDASREWMGYRLLELAAQRAGLSPRERDASVILRAANTSSDFPMLLEAAANKVLLARYGQALLTYTAIAARRDLRDFKPTKLLRIGDFPTLMPYQEDGEIKAGTINEGREQVMLGSYGRILRLSRQAIVNDDLNAFDDVFGSIGRVVARFENTTFYNMKNQNNGNGPKLSDGKPLFDPAHGNLAAAGADPSIETLGAGRAAIRKQKDLDGNPLNLPPKSMLVGPDVETKAEQLIAPLQAQQSGFVNPFSGKLDIIPEATLAGNAWEMYTSPEDLPVFVYGYLSDAPGPRVLFDETFQYDGMAWRVTEDFYCGAIDYRGSYRNPGS
ncbi:prohead protease/major capsid protein fusion protein [Sphingomonas sp. CROZ-RG-20F-R02-07]|uniref:prohead protease/major capsid protein fusion protein n=1 Tax=Sphingomonas sp. CROZ-RG-20F-R02-07 TaxID=2914832 RepID=UPI001F560DEC|nr:prohead protease/major capsid protein fusion protein [Sphingomonas sp. CROZ-RG-20F-R02-07]